MASITKLARWLVGVMLTVCGCATVQCRPVARHAEPLSVEETRYYAFEPVVAAERVGTPHRRAGYTVQRWRLTGGPAGSAPIELVWFRVESPARRPVILLSPIMGSNTMLSGSFARLFALHGFHAVIVKRPRWRYDPQQPPTQIEEYLHAAVIRNRQALDWVLRQPDIDAGQAGTFGISYGGIINAALAGVEPRARFHVLALAGGPIADVLEVSREHSIRRYWRRTRRAQGLTDDQLRQLFRKTIRTDPVRLARHVPAENVMVVVALFDRSIGRGNSLKLWRRLGEPQAVFLPAGHYTAILALPYLQYRALRFFTDRFAALPAAGNQGTIYSRQ